MNILRVIINNIVGSIRDEKNKKIVIFIFASISFIVMAIILVLAHLQISVPLGNLKILVTPYLAIGLIALLSYHTTLSLDNYSQSSNTLSEGIIRSALTATFIVMYVAYFSFASDSKFKFPDGLTDTLTNLTKIIVGFYFASTIASELINKKKGA